MKHPCRDEVFQRIKDDIDLPFLSNDQALSTVDLDPNNATLDSLEDASYAREDEEYRVMACVFLK